MIFKFQSAQHLQASQRLAETERRACELEQRLQQERAERERLQTLLQQGCTSDDVKVYIHHYLQKYILTIYLYQHTNLNISTYL